MDIQKLEASIARFKARTLELHAKRPRVVVVTTAPKPQESAHKEKVTLDKKCRAKTLEGKQCGFKASCGEFCKKHAIKT